MKQLLHLGSTGDGSQAESSTFDADKLTRHGVILGMTGSGKTGLGIVLLEELARLSIPCLIIDPKGDMGNLLLNFAGQNASALEPWVDPATARQAGVTASELAASEHQKWREGTARAGLDFDDPSLCLRDRFQILTPGLLRGQPINLLGSLNPTVERDPEGSADELDGLVGAILGMLGLDPNPLTSKPYVLLSALIGRAWAQGLPLDFPTLIQQVQSPPVRKLGVFQVDTFYPLDERNTLAMSLNSLLASPAFATWCTGRPLDIEQLLDRGAPRSTIIYLAHASEEERQFVVALLLGKLITWVRRQPGTSALRALVYLDEVAGYAPPNAMPGTKRPLLTLLKQARAQGVGMVLATQNPVDLDYKALSNAGTWWLGRLQTPQDRARVLDGLEHAGPAREALDKQLASLKTREFVVQQLGGRPPTALATRWALSYLRGPLTPREIENLVPHAPPEEQAAEPPRADSPVGLEIMPQVARDALVCFLRPDAPWLDQLGIHLDSPVLRPALAARVSLRFDDTKAGIDETVEWEALWYPLDNQLRGKPHRLDYDERDFTTVAPPGARYAEDCPPLDEPALFRQFKRGLESELYAHERLTLQKNASLSLVSRPNEPAADFAGRCQARAEELGDEAAAALRDKYEAKFQSLRQRAKTAADKVEALELEASSQSQNEWLSGAASLIGLFLGGRGNLTALTRAASRRTRTRRANQKLTQAQERAEELEEAVADLEQELATELGALEKHYRAAATQLEPFEVRLEKNDIRLEEVRLLWVPGPAARDAQE